MTTGMTGIIISEPGRMRECFHALLTSIPQIDRLHLIDAPAQAVSVFDTDKIDFLLIEANVVDAELEALFTELKTKSPDTKSMVITENSSQQAQLRAAGADEVLVRGASASAFIESLCRVVPLQSLRERISQCAEHATGQETRATI